MRLLNDFLDAVYNFRMLLCHIRCFADIILDVVNFQYRGSIFLQFYSLPIAHPNGLRKDLLIFSFGEFPIQILMLLLLTLPCQSWKDGQTISIPLIYTRQRVPKISVALCSQSPVA